MTAMAREQRLPQVRVLCRESASVPTARHFVVDVLKDWGLVSVLDDAALVVTELVTNAFEHTGTPNVRVVVRRVPSTAVRVIVIDKRPELWPALRSARPLGSDGRGLALVEAVTTAWGCTRLPWEKYVWADLKAAEGA